MSGAPAGSGWAERQAELRQLLRSELNGNVKVPGQPLWLPRQSYQTT